VENLFYTSFLVREGKLAIDFDEEGVPRICEYTLLFMMSKFVL
jgi:hypothetical protein